MTQNGTTLTPTPVVALPTAGPTFTEAPASVTLKVAYRGYSDILFTLRDASGIGLLEKLDRVMDKFEKMGIAPAIGHTSSGAPIASGGPVGETPVCEYHGPMKRNNRNNGWFCPKKMGDGTYCKTKVDDK